MRQCGAAQADRTAMESVARSKVGLWSEYGEAFPCTRTKEMMQQPLFYLPTCHLFGAATDSAFALRPSRRSVPLLSHNTVHAAHEIDPRCPP